MTLLLLKELNPVLDEYPRAPLGERERPFSILGIWLAYSQRRKILFENITFAYLRIRGERILLSLQDNAPCHSTQQTLIELNRRGINHIIWLPLSLDLNPIETLCNNFKDFIAIKCRDEKMVV